jgi:uncharacterized protein YkwD
MKNFIVTIVMFVFSVGVLAQSGVEITILNEVNTYRSENGLNKIVWNNAVYNVAKNQSTYMKLSGLLTHDQTVNISNFVEETDFVKRFTKFSVNGYPGENLAYLPDTFQTNTDKNIAIAKLVVYLWKNSPSHNELLLTDYFNYGAVSVMSTNFVIRDQKYFGKYLVVSLDVFNE